MVLKVGLDPITLKAQLLLKWLAEVVIITELRKGEGGGQGFSMFNLKLEAVLNLPMKTSFGLRYVEMVKDEKYPCFITFLICKGTNYSKMHGHALPTWGFL